MAKRVLVMFAVVLVAVVAVVVIVREARRGDVRSTAQRDVRELAAPDGDDEQAAADDAQPAAQRREGDVLKELEEYADEVTTNAVAVAEAEPPAEPPVLEPTLRMLDPVDALTLMEKPDSESALVIGLPIPGFESEGIDGLEQIDPASLDSEIVSTHLTPTTGVWLAGLDMRRDAASLDYLRRDFGERLVELPGIGCYLMPESLTPGTDEFVSKKVELLSQAVDLAGTPAAYRALIAVHAEDRVDIQAAQRILKEWERMDEGELNVNLEQGELLRKAGTVLGDEGLLGDAVRAYERALYGTEDPDHKFDAALGLAEAHTAMGEPARALAVVERTYNEVTQRSDTVTAQLGDCAVKAGVPARAVEWFEQIEKPTFEVRVKMADAYTQMGDTAKAIAVYEEAAQVFPQRALATIQAGLLYAARNDRDGVARKIAELERRLMAMTTLHRQQVEAMPDFARLMALKGGNQ